MKKMHIVFVISFFLYILYQQTFPTLDTCTCIVQSVAIP